MYYYIYDSFTRDPKYAKEISKISLKLTDLDILGEEARVTPIRKIKDLVDEAIKRDCKNIIAIGDDSTACSIIQSIAQQTPSVSFGMIPLRESIVAQVLGIPYGEQACEVISARRIEKIDLGKINNQYFLTSVKVASDKDFIQPTTTSWFRNLKYSFQEKYPEIKLKFGEGFTVTCKFLVLSILNILGTKRGRLKIKNSKQKVRLQVNPKDELLDVVVVGVQNKLGLMKNISRIVKQDFENIPNLSFFRTKRVEISTKDPVVVMADGQPVKATPLIIEVVPKRLDVIVGKERKF